MGKKSKKTALPPAASPTAASFGEFSLGYLGSTPLSAVSSAEATGEAAGRVLDQRNKEKKVSGACTTHAALPISCGWQPTRHHRVPALFEASAHAVQLNSARGPSWRARVRPAEALGRACQRESRSEGPDTAPAPERPGPAIAALRGRKAVSTPFIPLEFLQYYH